MIGSGLGSETVSAPPRRYDNIGCAFLGAAAAAALLITLAIGIPLLAPMIFPFAFVATCLIGGIIGVPLFIVAMTYRRVTWWTAALGGSVAGLALPLVWELAGRGGDWWTALALGTAGALGGVVFWSLLLERTGSRWE